MTVKTPIEIQTPSTTPQVENNPLQTSTGVYVTVHGHFYQPPRENPYLNTIERQPSAHPFHDWNERIYHECYRTNVFARILNDRGEIVGIVNNFEYLSFNIGPTLMSWLEKYDPEVYQKIIEADGKSCQRLNGHGNAIAQVYNHIILPLANERDKYTQIRWGKEDFRKRFGRETEGMWLAETAVDYPTLKVLIDEGIKFLILAPSQAAKCRPFPSSENPDPEWIEVGGGQIDPTRPYRCFINETEYLDIFFYDGPISGDMGFGEVLNSSNHFVSRLQLAVRGDHRPSQIISVATDGETFGHHKKDRERCLAYAFTQEFPSQGWTVTNYAHYLSINPPQWEVKLKPVTAWSCSHGVERWQDDCGCGGSEEIRQKWRRPLRDSLDWLRDKLINVYEEVGYKFFHNPWLARDEYIQVILDRSPEVVEKFFTRHASGQLTSSEQIDALRLLEMQRHTLLMYTSCGWFFEEISRPEGTQILRYAARALELAGEVAGVQLDQEFVSRLAKAPSNVEKYGNGAEVYRQLVITSQVTLEQVAAHYAISSLFVDYQPQQQVYCYDAHQLDYQRQQIGSLTLAVGQVRLVSEITLESTHLIFGVLHLGGWDFHCCIQPFSSRLFYSQIKEQLFDSFKQASVVKNILVMSKLFSNHSFDLQHLFAEERHAIIQQLTVKTKKRLDQLYTQVYRDNYSILLAFQRDQLPVPREFQVAAEVAISHRCLKGISELENNADDPTKMKGHLIELEAIASEANHLHCKLQIPEAKTTLQQLILGLLWQSLNAEDLDSLETDILVIDKMIEIGKQLDLNLCLDKPQELFYNHLHHNIVPECLKGTINNGSTSCPSSKYQLRSLFKLGEILSVNVSPFWQYLN
jgi:alpha-amylase/alpha-mannosidase (GH57 family)